MVVRGALELAVERDHVDVEEVAIAIERIVDVNRDLVHEPEHASTGRPRDPDVRPVEITKCIVGEVLGVERNGDRIDKEGAKRIEVGFPSPRRHANRLVDRVSEAEDEQERLLDGTEFGCLETPGGAAESLRVNDRRLLDEHAGGTKKT